jgi:predicted transcriptional regulator
MNEKDLEKMKKVKVLLYCTKKTPYLVKDDFPYENEPIYFTHYKEPGSWGLPLNGKIVAECEVETEEIDYYFHYEPSVDIGVGVLPEFEEEGYVRRRFENYEGDEELSTKTCLSYEQLDNYLKKKKGYALHISNLKIFDKPLSICEFDLKTQDRSKESPQNPKDHSLSNTVMYIKVKNNELKVRRFMVLKPINKAPQNMCSVFKVDSKNYEKEYYILISIRPEWLCKILNGEKTIEVRKKVLKEML